MIQALRLLQTRLELWQAENAPRHRQFYLGKDRARLAPNRGGESQVRTATTV